jgi:hypothetical protein
MMPRRTRAPTTDIHFTWHGDSFTAKENAADGEAIARPRSCKVTQKISGNYAVVPINGLGHRPSAELGILQSPNLASKQAPTP